MGDGNKKGVWFGTWELWGKGGGRFARRLTCGTGEGICPWVAHADVTNLCARVKYSSVICSSVRVRVGLVGLGCTRRGSPHVGARG
jgi:hypothetical protein